MRHAAKSLSLLVVIAAARLSAENATTPGELTSPYPTITNLAVDWKIKGDENLNAVCTVKFREASGTDWKDALPLRRVPAGVSQTMKPDFHWENRLSGSIFDLKPNTEYEIELKLSDPDGGGEERKIKARTRPVPRAPATATVRNVTPESIQSVQPGEIALLAPGNYGEFHIQKDGTADKPIVYRSTDAGAVFKKIEM
ncbi:MAG TPA: hypothetical protein VEJ63_24355, partial [Planctomycetota bacterium]|nr:hypothetical protein [Planctomycetota bacterium]